MTGLGIDRAFLPVFVVLTWVQRAVGRYHRQAGLRVAQASTRSGNPYAASVVALATYADQLFTASSRASGCES